MLKVTKGEMSREQLQGILGLKDRKSFRAWYLVPALSSRSGYGTHHFCKTCNSTRNKAIRGFTMKEEYDFSNAERGKFYRPDAQLNIPVYLDQDIENWFAEKAKANGVNLQSLVNELLRKDKSLIQEVIGIRLKLFRGL